MSVPTYILLTHRMLWRERAKLSSDIERTGKRVIPYCFGESYELVADLHEEKTSDEDIQGLRQMVENADEIYMYGFNGEIEPIMAQINAIAKEIEKPVYFYNLER